MKTTLFAILLLLIIGKQGTGQNIPSDSLYLGQTPPGTIPQIFELPTTPGTFAAERITISNDNKEIYYSEIEDYYPTIGAAIKYYKYAGNHWTGPFTLFEDYDAAAFSVSCDTLYFQNTSSVYESFFSVRNNDSWTTPRRFLSGLNSAHYVQVTNSGLFYISSIPAQGIGNNDWCRLDLSTPDSVAISLVS